jgi:signal transduction histidine kinase
MGKKIFAAWVFLFIAMATVAYLFFYQEKYRLSLEHVARVQETLSLIYDAQSNLSDAEAVARGYVMTGDEGHLQTFQGALKQLEQALDRLNQVTATEPEPQRLLGELALLIGRKQALLQVSIDLRRLKGSEVPEHVVATREGTKVQDEIRQLFDQMEDYAKKMLEPDWPREKVRIQTRVSALYLVIFGSLVLMLLPLYFLNREINQRRQAEEKVAVYQEDLRSLASQLSLAEERERRRIAVLLHDQVAQGLTAAAIGLRELQKAAAPSAPFAPELDRIGSQVEQAIRDTQSLTFKISPPILYELGLTAALDWLTEQVAKEHGLAASFSSDRQTWSLDHDLSVMLFQAVSELLINAVQHAGASRLEVSVRRDGPRLLLTVRDDGNGFRVSEIASRRADYRGFGLFSIRERLRSFGGEMLIESQPAAGASITLSVPLKNPQPGEKTHEHRHPVGGRPPDRAGRSGGPAGEAA